jgi:hypothetical protein
VKNINNKFASDATSIDAIEDALRQRAVYGIYKVVVEGFAHLKEKLKARTLYNEVL